MLAQERHAVRQPLPVVRIERCLSYALRQACERQSSDLKAIIVYGKLNRTRVLAENPSCAGFHENIMQFLSETLAIDLAVGVARQTALSYSIRLGSMKAGR